MLDITFLFRKNGEETSSLETKINELENQNKDLTEKVYKLYLIF